MTMAKYLFGVFVLIFILDQLHSSNAMTKAQIKQAGKLMRNVCQPKNKVTNEQIDNIKNGEFIDDKNVMCYIACVFTMAQTVKNGKLSYESALKQVDMMMPDNMKEAAKKAVTECRHIADKYKEICEAAFNAAKCMYKANPEVFLFP